MAEWALVLFTVLSQTAAGAYVTLWALDAFFDRLNREMGELAAKGIIALTGVSLIASLGHLGHPLEAYRALSHMGTSWLSREVALFGLFFVMTVVSFLRWRSGTSTRMVGLAGSLIAVLAVLTSGMVYVLPARPAWNNFGPLLFFILTAATSGPLFLAALVQTRLFVLGKNVYIAIGGALAVGLTSFILYLTMINGAGGVAAATGANMLASIAFWPRLLLGWVIPLGVLVYHGRQREWDIRRYVPILFVLVLIGELLGRELFYSSAVALKMFGL